MARPAWEGEIRQQEIAQANSCHGFWCHIASFTAKASDIVGGLGAAATLLGFGEVGRALVSAGLGAVSAVSDFASGQTTAGFEELGSTALSVATGGLGRIGKLDKFSSLISEDNPSGAFPGTAGWLHNGFVSHAEGYANEINKTRQLAANGGEYTAYSPMNFKVWGYIGYTASLARRAW